MICLGTLAAAVILYDAGELVLDRGSDPPAVVAGGFASFFAAQLYLVAGIRKVRSPRLH